MEASEKPQLGLDDVESEGTVRALEDRIEIERLTVRDKRAARVVNERAASGQSQAETVAKALEIGARLLESEGTAANVDYVKGELERQLGPLATQLGEMLSEGQEDFVERLSANFDPDRSGSVQQQLREMLLAAMEHQRGQLAKQFSAQDGANPLADFKDGVVRAVKSSQEAQQVERHEDRKRIEALTAEIAAMRERLGAKQELEAEQDRGTAKGRPFEERVHQVIDEIARGRGDVAHHVGDVRAETGGKKGDTVVEIGAAAGPALGKIAFDPKNAASIGRPKAWEVLNGSLEDRGADYAVLVVSSEEAVPPGTQSLVEYEGNKMIVAVDCDEPERIVLETAYCLARARALAVREDELALDALAMKEAIDQARRALESLKKARQSLTGMRKSADSMEEALGSIEEGVKTALGRADSLIAGALEASAE
jgi:hypothetical protein